MFCVICSSTLPEALATSPTIERNSLDLRFQSYRPRNDAAEAGLLSEMTPPVQATRFRSAFPVYSYMVTLRPFMRMNGVGQQEIERFVQAVAGGELSVRELELLAHGFFRGTAALREAIDQCNWKWSLEQM